MTLTRSRNTWTQVDNYGSLERRNKKKVGPEIEAATRKRILTLCQEGPLCDLDWFENPKVEVKASIKVSMEEGWVVQTYAVPTLIGVHVCLH